MAGKYIIRRLPRNSVVESKQGNIPCAHIYDYDGAVLPEISGSMDIRPRAARFVKGTYEDVYVVFYKTRRNVFCNFFFTVFTSEYGKKIVTVCRCKGSRAVKKHWEPVISFINDCSDRIEKLSYGESLEFSFKNAKE